MMRSPDESRLGALRLESEGINDVVAPVTDQLGGMVFRWLSPP
jgi:hypothetical protein